MVTGQPPELEKLTLAGDAVADKIQSGPGIIYFWAEWCGICAMTQGPVSEVLKDFSGVTVALKSGDDSEVMAYMKEHNLAWPVVNDSDGSLGERFGVRGVPAFFILNTQGDIVFTTVGYSTEMGLRLRLWLADLIS